jgi:glutamine amidotransferase
VHRRTLLAEVAPRLRRYILGETDSEVMFYVFLTHLEKRGRLDKPHVVEDVAEALRATMALVEAQCAMDEGESLYLTCIVTDGTTMAAHQGGKELYWSTYKTRCADRGTCPSLSPACEAPSESGYVNHLIFTSEPLQGENVWHEMRPGELIGVDFRMRVHRAGAAARELGLPVVR